MRSPDTNVPLAPLTTLGVGGPAQWYVEARSIDDVRAADEWAHTNGAELSVIAGGSNVVVADLGVQGLVVRIDIRGVSHTTDQDDVIVTVGAGERWDDLVAWAVSRGLSGIECLSGIPGTVGGTPIQNVGAYGQDVSGSIETVTVFDRVRKMVETLDVESCEFAYRSSRFKTRDAQRFVVCEVTFRLEHNQPDVTYPDLKRLLAERGITTPTLRQVREAVLAIRRSKGMVIDPDDPDSRSVGSFFTNPVVAQPVLDSVCRRTGLQPPTYAAGSGLWKIPAAWLLDKAGFSRGHGSGSVGLSTKHPLAIVNRGDASAAQVVAFAIALKRRVAECFGISLIPEPVFIGFGDDRDVSYLRNVST